MDEAASDPLAIEEHDSDVGGIDAPVARLLRSRLRLFLEELWVDHGQGLGDDFIKVRAPAIALSFEYEGFTVGAASPQTRFFCGGEGGMSSRSRDADGEARARYALEGFGAIELEALADRSAAPDSDANYLVNLDGDVHNHCDFSAHALPQLRAMGFAIDVDGDYPFQVVDAQPPWYAHVDDDGARPDWFNFELGVELGGHRVNLLPVLLEMLDGSGPQLDFSSHSETAPRFVELPEQRGYLELPAERFRTVMQVMGELYQGQAGPQLSFPAIRVLSLGQLQQAFDARRGPKLHWRGLTPPTLPQPMDLDADEDGVDDRDDVKAATAELQATLRPYQEVGLRFLQRLRAASMGGVLADDMGLGKTLQTIAHLCVELRSGRADAPTLIVTPTSLTGNWQRELSRFAPHLRVCTLTGKRRFDSRAWAHRADVVLTSYPILVRDDEYFAEQSYYYAVLDEAQTIKNPRSRAHACAMALPTQHRLCLTGTPIENSLSELWSLFEFLTPGLLGSQQQFRHFFQHPIEQQRDELRLATLRSQVAPFILRRMKQHVATELPPKTEVVRPVELAGKQRDLYESIRVAAHDQVRKVIRKKGFGSAAVTILDALMKLRQLCCDPRLVRGEAARFVRESAKYELLFSLLSRLLPDGHRVLVFSQFTSMLKLIAAGLDERGHHYVSLTGATQNRRAPIEAFERGKADVFLISLKAGGTGLNLVSADTVIHYDPWWNPAAQDQATDRAYRIGQTKPVFAYNLIVAGSVEERMLALQQRKRRLASDILGGAEAGGSGGLDEAEVEHLLSPLD